MKKLLQDRTLSGLMLLVFIGTMATVNLFSSDRTFSPSENRVLTVRPDFTMHALLSGRFTSQYESYISDQFAFRDVWVGVKMSSERLIGKKDSNGVFLGKDAYLMEQYISPSLTELEDIIRAILAFDEATPDLRKHVMLAPTAASLLSNQLPKFATNGDQKDDLERIHHLLPQHIHFIDVYSALDDKHEQSIFYKTDHHWTTHGAYYAYREFIKQMGLVPFEQDAFHIQRVTDEFYGSLYSKSGFQQIQPDVIDLYLPKEANTIEVTYMDEKRTTDSLYEMNHLQKKDKYTVFLNGNHGLITIKSDEPAEKRLLIVKDSYANSFIPFVTMHFGEIDVVDLRYYDEPLLDMVKERQYSNMLILYNVKTFAEDPSIAKLMEGLQ